MGVGAERLLRDDEGETRVGAEKLLFSIQRSSQTETGFHHAQVFWRRRLRDKPRRGDAARGEAGSGIKTSQRRAAACTLPRQAKGEACGTSPSKRRRHGEASRTSRPDARGRCSPGHTPPRPGAARYSGTSARRRYPRIPALVSNASCLAQQPRRRRMPHIAGLGRPVEAQFASFRSCSCAG